MGPISPALSFSRDLFIDKLEQFSVRLEHAKARIAATAASWQQAASYGSYAKPQTSNSSRHKYLAPYSYFSLYSCTYVPQVPALSCGARDAYADVRPFEGALFTGSLQMADLPRVSPSVVATTAPPPSASTFYPVAAPLPVLGALAETLQTP